MIERILVVGAGQMGGGIAQVAATAGLQVALVDVDEPALERGLAAVRTSLARLQQKGVVDDPEAVLARIATSTELESGRDCGLMVEAAPERFELKADLFARADALLAPDAILASNTSSIPIAGLAAATGRPDRVLGLHFFSPVPVMKLVEVVVALDTSEQTVARASGFAAQIGKTVIKTKDRSGFIVNFLLVPYLMAAVRMYEDGFASREDIDEGMKLGCGHPMGPLTLCDFIGLDVLYSVCDSLYEEFKRDEYAPPPLMKRMVVSGHLGRKTGRGFYEY
jgi:3-hydroxybutyryl-CoA dehydrogenase